LNGGSRAGGLRGVVLSAAAALALAGCATTAARMHSEEELGAVTRRCGVALGNLAQFEEEPRLLFLLGAENPEQFVCVRRWARRQSLRLVYMEGAEVVE
jgi:hypothetical protein